MRTKQIDMESCFRADEIVRIGRAIAYANLREKYRKALLEELDRTLPDYDRPLGGKVERQRKGISLKKIISALIP